ncbi:hypothetical protein AGIG_G8572 [Arapaima gigas]
MIFLLLKSIEDGEGAIKGIGLLIRSETRPTVSLATVHLLTCAVQSNGTTSPAPYPCPRSVRRRTGSCRRQGAETWRRRRRSARNCVRAKQTEQWEQSRAQQSAALRTTHHPTQCRLTSAPPERHFDRRLQTHRSWLLSARADWAIWI